MTLRKPLRYALALTLALLMGLVAAGTIPLPGWRLPLGLLLVASVVAVAVPLVVPKWRNTLALFLLWLVLEDLLRKFMGNDLRIALVKDAIFLVVLAGLLGEKRVHKGWSGATGGAGVAFFLLFAWALVMSVPTGLEDLRLPLSALRLYFFYAPLVLVGYVLARDIADLEKWVLRFIAIGAGAILVGIVQAFLGPTFLAPEKETPGLGLLVVIRGTEESGEIFRPSGTFVSSGRYASMAVVIFAIALAATFLMRPPRRKLAFAGLVLASAGIWISGGRGGVVAAFIILVFSLLAVPISGFRVAAKKWFFGVAAGIAALAIIAFLLPSMFGNRVIWYRSTLDPRSDQTEWTSRATSYWGDTLEGIEIGGVLGRGTGSESLGRQYILEGGLTTNIGLYRVEGGYGSIAIELGAVGLILWVAWSLLWVIRQWRCIQAVKGTALAGAGVALFIWILFFLFLGIFGGLASFQNYFPNAYFWLLSGILFSLPAIAKGADVSPDVAP
ncbi:MAG TPA: O-antigen ligase family protein [Actinomycetota bacterium]|nr:O-antigen ligase family protein [Actinomycetota bacterium]